MNFALNMPERHSVSHGYGRFFQSMMSNCTRGDLQWLISQKKPTSGHVKDLVHSQESQMGSEFSCEYANHGSTDSGKTVTFKALDEIRAFVGR